MPNATTDKPSHTVRVDLTSEQRAQARDRIGTGAESIALGARELEQLMASRRFSSC